MTSNQVTQYTSLYDSHTNNENWLLASKIYVTFEIEIRVTAKWPDTHERSK